MRWIHLQRSKRSARYRALSRSLCGSGHGDWLGNSCRDPYGRPLVYGSRTTALGTDYMIASESVALDILGFTYCGRCAGRGNFYQQQWRDSQASMCCRYTSWPCIFETFTLLDRLVIDDISVYKSRLRMGERSGPGGCWRNTAKTIMTLMW